MNVKSKIQLKSNTERNRPRLTSIESRLIVKIIASHRPIVNEALRESMVRFCFDAVVDIGVDAGCMLKCVVKQ